MAPPKRPSHTNLHTKSIKGSLSAYMFYRTLNFSSSISAEMGIHFTQVATTGCGFALFSLRHCLNPLKSETCATLLTLAFSLSLLPTPINNNQREPDSAHDG
jgi:hypothetical protein